jgi:hypothetical protein
MTIVGKRLEKMRNNPHDWRIEDILMVTKEYNIEIRSHGGSHYIFSHTDIDFHISIPAHRPIKPAYIKAFVKFIDTIGGRVK